MASRKPRKCKAQTANQAVTLDRFLAGVERRAFRIAQMALRDRDDALDVVGVHFVGGLVGSVLIGLFANPEFFGGAFEEGIFYGGDVSLLLEQALANGAAIVWSFVITLVIMIVLKKTIGVRVDPEAEAQGLDLALHAETAYHGGGLH
jgi:ammonia channel protein AmtB